MALPLSASSKDALLTLNLNELPIFKDAMPGVPGIDAQLLFMDTHSGLYVTRSLFHPGVRLPKHYHTGPVHLWTLSGKWYYAEHPDQPQTAGSYLYEPGGSIHTFIVPDDNKEVTETIQIISGANVNFDEDGNYLNIMDASSLVVMLDWVARERGVEPMKYIRPPHPQYTR